MKIRAAAIGAAVVALAGLAGLALWFLRGGPRLPPETDAIIERVSASDLSHVVAGEAGYADSSGVRIWYESIPAEAPEKGVVLLNISLAGNSLFGRPASSEASGRRGIG